MATEQMTVFVREEDTSHKTYAVNLDTCMTPQEWEERYLKDGFREPDTGRHIPAGMITTVAVRPVNKSPLGAFPTGGALAWLEEQVDQTCAMGLS